MSEPALILMPETGPTPPRDPSCDAVFCVECGYALRHIAETGDCPECGFAVAESIRTTPVHPGVRAETEQLQTGLRVTLASAVFTAVIPWVTMLFGYASGGDEAVLGLWTLMVIAEHALWGIGLGTVAGAGRDGVPFRLDRRGAQVAGVLAALSGAVTAITFAAIVDQGEETAFKALMGMAVATLVCRAVSVWCLGGYLRSVFRGLGVASGYGLLQFLRWSVTLVAVAALAVVATPWAFLITDQEQILNDWEGDWLGLWAATGMGTIAVVSAAGLFAVVAIAVLLRKLKRTLREQTGAVS